jgi:hypothetical protein
MYKVRFKGELKKTLGKKKFYKKKYLHLSSKYSRNVMDVDWGLVIKLALPAKVTKRANKVIEIYERSH